MTNDNVSVQGDNTVVEGLIWAPSALLSLRVRLCTRRSSALKGLKSAPSRLEDSNRRNFGDFQGRR